MEHKEEAVIEDPVAVLTALERAKSDAKKFREERDGLEQMLQENNEKLNKFNEDLLKQKVLQKISENGIKDGQRLLKFMQLDGISLDENFEVVGLDSRLEEVKKDLPELFDAKLRVGGKADAAAKEMVDTPYSASEIQAAKILGRI